MPLVLILKCENLFIEYFLIFINFVYDESLC